MQIICARDVFIFFSSKEMILQKVMTFSSFIFQRILALDNVNCFKAYPDMLVLHTHTNTSGLCISIIYATMHSHCFYYIVRIEKQLS